MSRSSGWQSVVTARPRGGGARSSITGFAVGTAAGFMLGHRLGPRRRGPTLIVVELVLLVIVTIIAGNVDGRGVSGGFTGVVLVALGSFAMGIQTEAIRRVAGVAIATTYQSGSGARGSVRRRPVSYGGRPRPPRLAAPLPILAAVLVTYCGGRRARRHRSGTLELAARTPVHRRSRCSSSHGGCVPRWFAAIDQEADSPGH